MLSLQSDLYVGFDHFLMLASSSSSSPPPFPCFDAITWKAGNIPCPPPILSFFVFNFWALIYHSLSFFLLFALFLLPPLPPSFVMLKPRFDPFSMGSDMLGKHSITQLYPQLSLLLLLTTPSSVYTICSASHASYAVSLLLLVFYQTLVGGNCKIRVCFCYRGSSCILPVKVKWGSHENLKDNDTF